MKKINDLCPICFHSKNSAAHKAAAHSLYSPKVDIYKTKYWPRDFETKKIMKTNSISNKGMTKKQKLMSELIEWAFYEDKVIIQTKVVRQPDIIYFSGSTDPTKWDNPSYIDLAPKGNFITKFLKRLWNFRKLEQLLK